MKRNKIAITMGDPAGIGPEIIVKMFLKHNLRKYGDVFVIGDLFPMLKAQRSISRKIAIKPINNSQLTIHNLRTKHNTIPLVDMENPGMDSIIPGEEQKKAGHASFTYIKKALELAKKRKIDAIVTAPINKHSLHMAGYKYPGHTEILAKFTKTKNFAMMLMGEKLKVILVTIHTSLKSVPSLLTRKKILDKIKLAHKSLKKDFRIKAPKIAVLGLNPHSGENSAFGREEEKIIIPAVKSAVKAGIRAYGPFPPDTIFGRIVNKGEFDAAVCMYHDQGLIPLKLLSFDTGVNVTMGLPVTRTSPDHGTAYDIAGTGKASEKSILSALRAAAQIAKNRKI